MELFLHKIEEEIEEEKNNLNKKEELQQGRK